MQKQQLRHADLVALDDHAFEIKLGTVPVSLSSKKIIPDWQLVQSELQGRDMTQSLLWEEYRHTNIHEPERCLSYSQFSRCYRDWLSKQRISMRQFHIPGDKLFVDFCGRTVSITNQATGEVTQAQIFVGVLGGSGYTFAYAVPTQKIADWVECHVAAMTFFGGVPEQVVCDNLKSAVIKHSTQAIEINRAYSDWAEHYDVLINPGRSRKPKDKPLAEVGVQIVQRWLLAPLRRRVFFSVDELNSEMSLRIQGLNNKVSKKY